MITELIIMALSGFVSGGDYRVEPQGGIVE
jgi:hypothetical protein